MRVRQSKKQCGKQQEITRAKSCILLHAINSVAKLYLQRKQLQVSATKGARNVATSTSGSNM